MSAFNQRHPTAFELYYGQVCFTRALSATEPPTAAELDLIFFAAVFSLLYRGENEF